MIHCLRLFYTVVLPELKAKREYGLLVILFFVFHVAPFIADRSIDPWEQPYIYANF